MNGIEYPPALALSTWERAAAPVKARYTTLRDGLKSLKRLYDAVDLTLFDIPRLSNAEQAKERGKQIDDAIERRVKPLQAQARSVESLAEKSLIELRKTKAGPAEAIGATDAASRGAATLLRDIDTLTSGARIQLARRLAELESAKAGVTHQPEQTPHRLRLRSKVKEGLGIVKNRPDRDVYFVVCAGNRECLPYLGAVAGTSQKALLKTVMKGDTGMKFYVGRCVYEESCYTFVGPGLPGALRNRLERGLLGLTGSRWRVRIRNGTIKDENRSK